jgi:hypothetical protein
MGPLAALRSGAAEVLAQRRSFALVAVAMTATAIGSYAIVTFGNGALFGYNFFNDVPPSNTARIVAVVSLWILALVEAALATTAFGAFCALGITPSSARAALTSSLRQLKRDCWWAIPAWSVTAVLVTLVLPGLFVAGPFAAIAVARIGARPRWLRYVGRVFGPQLVIGLLPNVLALTIWILAWIASLLPSPPTAGSAAILTTGVFAAMTVMAWTAAASAQIYLHDLRTPPWPPPRALGTPFPPLPPPPPRLLHG